MGILFVGGVHGVGKSTCCNEVAKRTNLRCFTASDLIKTERQSAISSHSKSVLNPDGNQKYLIRSIHKLRQSHHETVILDGHFTLLQSGGGITVIEVDVFAQLELEVIVVFRDDPASIVNRLNKRDGQFWSISMITAQQNAEIGQGQHVASNLKIPITILDAFDIDGLTKAVGNL